MKVTPPPPPTSPVPFHIHWSTPPSPFYLISESERLWIGFALCISKPGKWGGVYQGHGKLKLSSSKRKITSKEKSVVCVFSLLN
jgi:hypothetical protein